MIQAALLDQLDTLSPAQLLELIGHAWNRLDAGILPMTETLMLELPETTQPRQAKTAPTPSPPSTDASRGSSPPAPA